MQWCIAVALQLVSASPDERLLSTAVNILQVILCSACSGHGFKLSPAIGLVLADMVRHGSSQEYASELQLHKLDRRRAGHEQVLERFQQ